MTIRTFFDGHINVGPTIVNVSFGKGEKTFTDVIPVDVIQIYGVGANDSDGDFYIDDWRVGGTSVENFETDLSDWEEVRIPSPHEFNISTNRSQSGSQSVLCHYDTQYNFQNNDSVFWARKSVSATDASDGYSVWINKDNTAEDDFSVVFGNSDETVGEIEDDDVGILFGVNINREIGSSEFYIALDNNRVSTGVTFNNDQWYKVGFRDVDFINGEGTFFAEDEAGNELGTETFQFDGTVN